MAERLVEFTVLGGEAGDLEIALNEAGRQQLSEVLPELRAGSYNGTWASAFGDLIEWQLGNGWRWLRADEVGALTDEWGSTILSDDVDESDQGDILHVGRVWWYPQYETHDQLEELLRYGKIRLQRGSQP